MTIADRDDDRAAHTTAQRDDVHALVPLYLTACESEGKSPATLIAYRETLTIFLRLVESEGLPNSARTIGPPDVYRYIAAIRRAGVGDSTQHRRHREVKHFFSWLKRMELVSDNPFQKVPLIRIEQKVVRPYGPEELQAILGCFEAATELGSRNRAIVLFLLDTGVRASELVGLDLEDLDFLTGRARVRGKGRKQRVVAFGPEVIDALLHYFDFRGDVDGPLFRSLHGGRLTRHALGQVFVVVRHQTGLSRVHAHRFRHTFATVAIRSAAREIDVQHLLGHSTSTMVRRYTRTYDAEQAAGSHHLWSPVAILGAGQHSDP